MAIYNYKKYKVSLDHDSKKTQGLQTGDIVRRQYYEGLNGTYSLMCVLDYGTDTSLSDEGEILKSPYFIGALLEGDPPQTNEILDFVRITNLFNEDRSGALYLTSSDSESPYMDIIDGIGKNKSLCYPESVAFADYKDPSKQYIIEGLDYASATYTRWEQDNNRICRIAKNHIEYNGFIGLKQDFSEYIENPQRVIISYKIKSSGYSNVKLSLGYADGEKIDGELSVSTTPEWTYHLHAISIEWSGRHLRSFLMNVNDNMRNGDQVWIADFNIILQSSFSGFAEASHVRVGKLDGIVDPVFGRLSGYGGYLQKLYASQSAHISGTLTAGDENGFASTFYAGKIHKNAFLNSVSPYFSDDVEETYDIINPTGIGSVYKFSEDIYMTAQDSDWLAKKIGDKYCFSFWAYMKHAGQLRIIQNGVVVGVIPFGECSLYKWVRHSVSFELNGSGYEGETMTIGILPAFDSSEGTTTSSFYFTAPQLESGENVTQYQPTDEILSYNDNYGAWFSQGGIGGTIQNPLLQLNYDGEGSIGTRTKSFLLKVDGSGYLANTNIRWDKYGKVTFGKDVTLNWENLSDDTKDLMTPKSIKLIGGTAIKGILNSSTGTLSYSPSKVRLKLTNVGFSLEESTITWYYQNSSGTFVQTADTEDYFDVYPEGNCWLDSTMCVIKCIVIYNHQEFSDAILVQKDLTEGYQVKIKSSSGDVFKNGDCTTNLTADVYFQGALIPPEEVAEKFIFNWSRTLPDGKVLEWYDGVDNDKQLVKLNHEILSSEKVLCGIKLRVSTFLLGRGILGKDII